MPVSVSEVATQLPLLKLLSAELRKEVLRSAKVLSYPKRAMILAKGQREDQLGFVVSGQLQVIDHLPNGREIGLNLISAGSFFGELTVIDQYPRSASVMALKPTEILWLPGVDARRMFFESPPVAEAMLQHFARMIRRMSVLQALQGIPNVFQRVSALLNFIKEVTPGGLAQIPNMPTHQEVAIMINTSRETVSRAISELVKTGVLEKDVKRLIIRQPEKLAEFTEEKRFHFSDQSFLR